MARAWFRWAQTGRSSLMNVTGQYVSEIGCLQEMGAQSQQMSQPQPSSNRGEGQSMGRQGHEGHPTADIRQEQVQQGMVYIHS